MKKFFKGFIVLTVFLLISSILLAADRSSKWEKVRKEFIKTHPICAVCGSTKSLQVHHIKPFHLYPEFELDPNNLITLCTSKYPGFSCHFSVGHCGDFKWENPDVVVDAEIVHDMILKYKGYTVVPDIIQQYLLAIHERAKIMNTKNK